MQHPPVKKGQVEEWRDEAILANQCRASMCMKSTGLGKTRFTVVHVENNTIINK